MELRALGIHRVRPNADGDSRSSAGALHLCCCNPSTRLGTAGRPIGILSVGLDRALRYVDFAAIAQRRKQLFFDARTDLKAVLISTIRWWHVLDANIVVVVSCRPLRTLFRNEITQDLVPIQYTIWSATAPYGAPAQGPLEKALELPSFPYSFHMSCLRLCAPIRRAPSD